MKSILRFLTLAVLMPALAALAQAPTEDRSPHGSPLADAQQRTEFARKASVSAEERVRTAQQDLREADARMKEAQKVFDAARAVQDKAKKELATAQSAAAAAKKDFDRQSVELDRTRRGQK